MAWVKPSTVDDAAWLRDYTFGVPNPSTPSGAKLLLERIHDYAALARPGELLSALRLLDKNTVLNVLHAFRVVDQKALGRRAGVLPEQPATVATLHARLMLNDSICGLQGTALTGIVHAAWPEINFHAFSGKSGLAAIMGVLQPLIDAKTRELLGKAARVDTRLDTTIYDCSLDRPTHKASELDCARVPVVTYVASKNWLRINLQRFFSKKGSSRAPVLYARTGCERLIEPVNTALKLASLQTFAHWKQLYEWIRDMLTVNDLAPSFEECMDGLCRCVHLP
jgi:hypothetical protein